MKGFPPFGSCCRAKRHALGGDSLPLSQRDRQKMLLNHTAQNGGSNTLKASKGQALDQQLNQLLIRQDRRAQYVFFTHDIVR
jgi:hypothetical protein